MICLDTHALLWWTADPDRLSAVARGWIGRMEAGPGGYASAMSIWEIGLKVKQGSLHLGISIETFVARLKAAGVLEIVPVTERIFIENLNLDWSHRDPADRTIVATARELGVPLLTNDGTIRAFMGVDAIW